MLSEFERSKIERAKVGINTPGTEDELKKKPATLSPTKVKPPENWSDNFTSVDEVRMRAKASAAARLVRTTLIIAILAVVGSASFLMYKLFDPFARPSDKNIILTPAFPVAIASGEMATMGLTVENRNRAALESVVATIIYPPGTKSPDDPLKDLREEKRTIGTIEGGARATIDTKAIFLGQENTDKDILVLLEYRFSGIASEFRKGELRTPVHLTSSPVNIRVRTLGEVNAGQQFEYAVDVSSNTVVPVGDLVLKVDFPPGFIVNEIDPKPTVGDNYWKIGRLDPTGKYQVVLRGVINGEDTEKRAFYSTVGVGSAISEREVSLEYSKILNEMNLKKPFINLAVLFDGKTDAVASPGVGVAGIVTWKNTTPYVITNVQIEVKMKGNVDRKSIRAQDGFYRSLDDTLYWDERTSSDLELLRPGSSGVVAFTFQSIPVVSGSDILRNPIITAEVTVRGNRVANNVPEEFSTAAVGAVRIASDAKFSSKVTHYVGPIANRGPIPPRINQETTYTVTWSIVNTSNDLESAVVRTGIPVQARWAGAIIPGDAPLIYDPVQHEIVWSPGKILAGTGVSSPPKEVHFQLGVTPSVTQFRNIVSMTDGIEFSARDAYTGKEFSQKVTAASTALSADPKARPNDGIVAE